MDAILLRARGPLEFEVKSIQLTVAWRHVQRSLIALVFVLLFEMEQSSLKLL